MQCYMNVTCKKKTPIIEKKRYWVLKPYNTTEGTG